MSAFLGPASPPADGVHGASRHQGDQQQMLGGDKGYGRLLPEVRAVWKLHLWDPLAPVGPYSDVCGKSGALAISFHRKTFSFSLLPQAAMSM